MVWMVWDLGCESIAWLWFNFVRYDRVMIGVLAKHGMVEYLYFIDILSCMIDGEMRKYVFEDIHQLFGRNM